MESKILSAIISDRGAYNVIRETIDADDFSEIGQVLLNEISQYYKLDENAKDIDRAIISDRLHRKYAKQFPVLNQALENLQNVSVPNVLSEYVDLRLHSIGNRIASALSGADSGNLMELMQEYQFLQERREEALGGSDNNYDVYEGADINDIFEELDPAHLIKLYPPSLNERLNGGILRGQHVVIFARPETGKSLFVINLAAELLRNGQRVLYVGNEDPAVAIRARLVANITGMDKMTMLAQPDRVGELINENGYQNLIFVSTPNGSVADIRGLVAKYSPDVFIVDQIRNLQTTQSLTKVESLEYIAQSMRAIAKEKSCVAVSITQAGDSAENSLILSQGDVDFSNTGIPSTADLMIGIGTNYEYTEMGQRMLSLPKNKVSGIHEAFPVKVDTKYSRVSDV